MATKMSMRVISRFRASVSPIMFLALTFAGPPAGAQGSDQGPQGPDANNDTRIEYRFPLKALPDLALPSMDAAKGRTYFATRACVVCHSVNGVGGTRAAALDLPGRPEVIDVLGFVTRMWRGARPMISLQDRVLGEQIELTAEELGDIIAFLHTPAEQKRFSENDIPKFIKDVMAREAQRRGLE